MNWLRRYRALVRTAWLVDLQYRAGIVIWLFSGIAEPAISLGIWWAISAYGPIDGYGQGDFARYFMAVILIDQITLAWDAYYIDTWIRNGEINFRLARPMNPIHEAIADNLSYKLRTGGTILAFWLLLAAVWPVVRIAVDPGRWALAALATLGAAAIRFLNNFATGLLGFWTTRVLALLDLQFGLGLFLSGRIAPMEVLPPAVQRVAALTWYPYTLAFPVDLLTRDITTPGDIARGFAGQVVWLALWLGVYLFVWRRGRRHYGAVGG
jgi:ABC-2 type transport system permease protein